MTTPPKPHREADIYETWNEEIDSIGYYIVYDQEDICRSSDGIPWVKSGWRPDKIYRRRCDASRIARRNAEHVYHWYPI